VSHIASPHNGAGAFRLESGRRARFYTLTPAGRKQLAQEKRNWRKVITAVTQVLGEEG
jgi:DNA-binding MarR family transcriptional regulator